MTFSMQRSAHAERLMGRPQSGPIPGCPEGDDPMRRSRRGVRSAAMAIAGLGLVAATVPAVALAAARPATVGSATVGPTVKLIAAQNVITVQKYGKQRV